MICLLFLWSAVWSQSSPLKPLTGSPLSTNEAHILSDDTQDAPWSVIRHLLSCISLCLLAPSVHTPCWITLSWSHCLCTDSQVIVRQLHLCDLLPSIHTMCWITLSWPDCLSIDTQVIIWKEASSHSWKLNSMYSRLCSFPDLHT